MLGATSKVLKSFCTTREAARLLGVSVRTAQLWAEGGPLQAWKTRGGHRRISRASVAALLTAQPDALPATAGAAADSLTILVVDDEQSVLRLYARHLRKWPLKLVVVTARSGIEALVRLGMTRPDLLVTNLQLPDIDGVRLLAALHAMPEFAAMTTVAVSAGDPPQSAAGMGVPAGVPVLPKPIPFERLHDIATVLAGRKRRIAMDIKAR
jgi:excisionase family DNA binding protein